MNILIASDAWLPQVNGVVVTLQNTIRELEKLGHQIITLTPCDLKSFSLPIYREVRIGVPTYKQIKRLVKENEIEAIHIATEGPIGFMVRRYCIKNNLNFTTSYHTNFSKFAKEILFIPEWLTFAYLRHFHEKASTVMYNTESMKQTLLNRGFTNLKPWTRGIDSSIFNLKKKERVDEPTFVYLGRISKEKNIEDFLNLDLPGKKVVIGDGPMRKELENKYSNVEFTGYLFGDTLANRLSECDVKVFPSKFDTFGLVMIEAMACGVPIAAYPVTGPIDVIDEGVTGILDEDLERAAIDCLNLDFKKCSERAISKFSWKVATQQFLNNLIETK